MLPKIVTESQVQSFKFWFGDRLEDGVHFHNELYYCLQKTSITDRSHLYHLACRLMQHDADIFITASAEQCSLWANLRNQKVLAANMANRLSLPTAEILMCEAQSSPAS